MMWGGSLLNTPCSARKGLMFGKYKSLRTSVELCHFLDILRNHRLYLSQPEALNDPFEGMGFQFLIPGKAGISIPMNCDQLPDPKREALSRFGVASLTSDVRSAQMWAHYADGYRGVCICFRSGGRFAAARPVWYVNYPIKIDDTSWWSDEERGIEYFTERSLLFKHDGWSYEKESRIVQQTGEDETPHYFCFEPSDIVAVIIGQNASQSITCLVRDECERLGTPLYTTAIRELSNQVGIVPYDFHLQGDGETFDNQVAHFYEEHEILPFSDVEMLANE